MLKAWAMMHFPHDVDVAYAELRRLRVRSWEINTYGVCWKDYISQYLVKRKGPKRGRRAATGHGRGS